MPPAGQHLIAKLLNPQVLNDPGKAASILDVSHNTTSILFAQELPDRVRSILDSLLVYLHDHELYTGIAKGDLDSMRRRLTALTYENTLRLKAFQKIMNHANNSRLNFLLLKGPAVSMCYPNYVHRYQNDFDLLIHPNQADKVPLFLGSHGYICPIEPAAIFRDRIHRRRPYLRYRDCGGTAGAFDNIDMHFDIQATWDPYTYDVASIFERQTTIDLLGTPVAVPDPVDHMVYICTHAYNHYINTVYQIDSGQPRDRILMGSDPDHMLRRFLDLAFFKDSYNFSISSSNLVSRAIAFNAHIAVTFCFDEVEYLFNPQ